MSTKVVKSAAPQQKRKPPNAGKGRKKGVPNKVTGDLRAMVLGALDKAGGEAYLTKQAQASPAAFLSLIGKCMPRDMKIEGDVGLTVIIKKLSQCP